MTAIDGEALGAMRAHHRTLEEQLRARVAVLAAAVAEDHPYEPAAGALVAYLAGEVLPHATAEEHTIYPQVWRVRIGRAQDMRGLAPGADRPGSQLEGGS